MKEKKVIGNREIVLTDDGKVLMFVGDALSDYSRHFVNNYPKAKKYYDRLIEYVHTTEILKDEESVFFNFHF